MKKYKLYTTLFLCMFLIFICVPSITFAIKSNTLDKVTTFYVTPNKDEYILNLTETSEEYLYPGSEVIKEFNISNSWNKTIQLYSLTINDFVLKNLDNNSIIEESNSTFKEFVSGVYIKLIHENNELFSMPLSEFLGMITNSCIINKDIIFLKNSGSRFKISMYMDNSLGNNTQNLNANFNIRYNFIESTYKPDIPSEEPGYPSPNDPNKPIDPTTKPGNNNESSNSLPLIDVDDTVIDNSSENDSNHNDYDGNNNSSEDIFDDHSSSEEGSSNDISDSSKKEEKLIISEKLIQTGVFMDYSFLILAGISFITLGLYFIFFKKNLS